MMERKGWAASTPERSLVVVPLLPASRTSGGSLSPAAPAPWTWYLPDLAPESSSASILTPSALRHRMVEVTSAEAERLDMWAVPLAMALKMSAR